MKRTKTSCKIRSKKGGNDDFKVKHKKILKNDMTLVLSKHKSMKSIKISLSTLKNGGWG